MHLTKITTRMSSLPQFTAKNWLKMELCLLAA